MTTLDGSYDPLADSHVYWLLLSFLCGICLLFLYVKLTENSKNLNKKQIQSHITRQDQSVYDVIVVGSGILGSAMAATLGRQGRRVLVIERDLKQPNRIVGELLQPGGCLALKKLGLDECTSDIDSQVVKGYVLHKGGNECVTVPYPESLGYKGEGYAFHHGRFVMALRNAAKKQENVKYVEGTVNKLLEQEGQVEGVQYRDKESGENSEVKAPLTIVADGCFSKLRRGLVKESPVIKSYFAGMLMKDCPQKKPNHAELVLADPSPVLIYKISSEYTRILVDIKGGLPKNIKEYFREVIYPQLPEHIQGPFLEATETESIRSMPNSFLAPVPIEKPGVLCLGDALNMRHPLTGGGMSVALNDVVLVRDLFKDIPDLRDIKSVLQASKALYMQRKNKHSFVVNVLAQALYELFAADNEYLEKLKNACFSYFQLGGECVNGPVGLLSVLNPKPSILLGHFFAVALYAIIFTFQSEGVTGIFRSIKIAVGIFTTALAIIFPLVWSELKTISRY